MKHRPVIVGLGGTLRQNSSSSRALGVALDAAAGLGATTEMLDLWQLDLPLYRPGLPIEAFGRDALRLVEASRDADAMLWSTSAYHGSLAGVTKNALDFLEFAAGPERTYLDGRSVGLVATAAGEMAAVTAVTAMVSIAHSLRATVASLLVAIPHIGAKLDSDGGIADPHTVHRLETLGASLVEMTTRVKRAEVSASDVRFSVPLATR